MHIITLPLKNIPFSKYNSSNIPTPFPQIPNESCRMIIKEFHVPLIEPTTTNPSRVFVSVKLFTSDLKPCDEIGGLVYSLDEVRKWIIIHIIQSKSNKRFSVHLDTGSHVSLNNEREKKGNFHDVHSNRKPSPINFETMDNVIDPFDQEGDV